MKTLILGIDRDNDIGEKTGLGSPILGREACLNAAQELGLKDPEDSDINAVFAAVAMHDQIKKEGKDTEVVIICGHKYLGEKADRGIAEQLDGVLDKVKPSRAILVSDGASDEAVLPILQSRVKVDHVRRFVVKQHLGWEDKLYRFFKFLEDDKIRIGVGVPITLLMLFYGFFSFGWPEIIQDYVSRNVPLGIILFTLGLFFLTRAIKLAERISDYSRKLRKGFRAAEFSPIVSLLAMIILIFGTFLSYQQAVTANWLKTEEVVLGFAIFILPWIIFSTLIRILGAFLDPFLRHRKVRWSYLHYVLQIVAVGFIIYGALIGLQYLAVNYLSTTGSPVPWEILSAVIFYVTVGICIAIASALAYRHLRIVLKKKKATKQES
jgi:putative membrane protein